MILSIDPSSSRCGYAVMREDETLIEAGLFTPRRSEDPANARIRSMALDLRETLNEYRPESIVIEDTGSHMHAARGGGGAGLMVWGKAVGYMLAVCDAWLANNTASTIVTVESQVWTKGVSKIKRQQWIMMKFRQYDKRKDSGFDISDAIGLAMWLAAEIRCPRDADEIGQRPPRKRAATKRAKKLDSLWV